MKAELIQALGNDLTVVNAARVSFDKESTELSDKDVKLIHYLARHNHFTPFTHCVITMREEVPIFVARQRFKHTVGFSYNEVSRRYVDKDPEFHIPVFRRRANNVKQGSSDEFPPLLDYCDWVYKRAMQVAERAYKKLLELEVCPEQARIVLPQSMMTSYYVTGSLSAWARAYNLRTEPTAQMEIQQLANMWGALLEKLFPISWPALTQQEEKNGIKE